MKVAVSIPDPLFHEAESVSRRLRLPRSRVYARALEAFVRQHSKEDLTAKLDKVVTRVGSAEPGWEAPGLEVLRREKW